MSAWRVLRRIDPAVNDVDTMPAIHRRPDEDLAATEMADAGDEERARELGVETPPGGCVEDVGAVLRDAEGEPAELGGEHRDRSARAGEVIVQMDQTTLAHARSDDAGLGEVGELAEERRQAGRSCAPGETEGTPPALRRAPQDARVRAEQALRASAAAR